MKQNLHWYVVSAAIVLATSIYVIGNRYQFVSGSRSFDRFTGKTSYTDPQPPKASDFDPSKPFTEVPRGSTFTFEEAIGKTNQSTNRLSAEEFLNSPNNH